MSLAKVLHLLKSAGSSRRIKYYLMLSLVISPLVTALPIFSTSVSAAPTITLNGKESYTVDEIKHQINIAQPGAAYGVIFASANILNGGGGNDSFYAVAKDDVVCDATKSNDGNIQIAWTGFNALGTQTFNVKDITGAGTSSSAPHWIIRQRADQSDPSNTTYSLDLYELNKSSTINLQPCVATFKSSVGSHITPPPPTDPGKPIKWYQYASFSQIDYRDGYPAYYNDTSKTKTTDTYDLISVGSDFYKTKYLVKTAVNNIADNVIYILVTTKNCKSFIMVNANTIAHGKLYVVDDPASNSPDLNCQLKSGPTDIVLTALSTDIDVTKFKSQVTDPNNGLGDDGISKGTAAPGDTQPTEPDPSCGAQVTGTGWLLCPMLNSLAGLNDVMWKVAKSMLNVSPLTTGTDNGVYQTWNAMRNLANVIFVIFFMIVIYSQLTGGGFSNYSIKKMLPGIIVVAILVNVSYVLMQVLVDLSNIIGINLYKFLESNVHGVTPSPGEAVSGWFEGLVFTGGAVAAGTAIVGGVGIGFLFWLLAPVILAMTLGFLVAILTLMFRQAFIIILVILSPIALVAYMLPNTKSWFKKWKDNFQMLLMMFPLAAVVFGGAEIAAYAILGKTDAFGNNIAGFMDKVTAHIILVIPLFALPFISRQGGQMLNQVGGAMKKLADKANSSFGSYAKGRRGQALDEHRARESSAWENKPRNSWNVLGRGAAATSRLGRRTGRAAKRSSMEREARAEEAREKFKNQTVRGEVSTWNGKTAKSTQTGAIINPETGAPVINPATGRPLTRTLNTAYRDLARTKEASAEVNKEITASLRFGAQAGDQEHNLRRHENDYISEKAQDYDRTVKNMPTTPSGVLTAKDELRVASRITKEGANEVESGAGRRTEANFGVKAATVRSAAAMGEQKLEEANTQQVVEEMKMDDNTHWTPLTQSIARAEPAARASLGDVKYEDHAVKRATAMAQREQSDDIVKRTAEQTNVGAAFRKQQAGAYHDTAMGMQKAEAAAIRLRETREEEDVVQQIDMFKQIPEGGQMGHMVTEMTAGLLRPEDKTVPRAAARQLVKYSPGRDNVAKVVAGVLPNTHTNSVEALRHELATTPGLIDRSVILDTWTRSNRSLNVVASDPKTYNGLKAKEWSTQDTSVVGYAATIRNAITQAQAIEILGNKELTANFDKKRTAIFTAISLEPAGSGSNVALVLAAIQPPDGPIIYGAPSTW